MKRFAIPPKLPLLLVVTAFVLVASYCTGRSDGARSERTKTYKRTRAAIVDTIHLVERELHVDTVRVVVTRTAADTARRRFAASDVRIKIVSSTELSIDDLPPATMIPAASVIPDLENARALIHLDSISYAALDSAFRHQQHLTALERRRANLAESELAHRRGSRLGLKTGILLGSLVTYTVTHPAQVAGALRRVVLLIVP